jgi:hypothetical protein
MGVFSGDIIASEIPATLQLAVYMVYVADADEKGDLQIEVRLMQGDNQMVKGKIAATVGTERTLTFVFPRALITFSQETTFRILVKLDGQEEREVLNKRVLKGSVS